MTTAQEIMTKDVKFCSADATLADAVEIMKQCDCGSVPIVDQAQFVIGMVTDRDVALAAFERGATLAEIPVRDVMSRNLVTVQPDDDVARIEMKMASSQVRRVPVVDGGRLVGLVCIGKLARGNDVPDKSIGKTLSAISQPS